MVINGGYHSFDFIPGGVLIGNRQKSLSGPIETFLCMVQSYYVWFSFLLLNHKIDQLANLHSYILR